MKKAERPLNVSVKIGLDNEWSVSEAIWVTADGFECQLERVFPLEAVVKIVIMLPSCPQENKISQKIDCEGVIQSVREINNDKNEIFYRVGIQFLKISSAERKQIEEFLASNHNL